MLVIRLLTKHSSGQVVSQITVISYLTTIELINCMHAYNHIHQCKSVCIIMDIVINCICTA